MEEYRYSSAWEKYYNHNLERDKAMFKDELKDLEDMYKEQIKDKASQMEAIMPDLLYYMDHLVTLHKDNRAIKAKLDGLMHKVEQCHE